jgi:hypothetical protein
MKKKSSLKPLDLEAPVFLMILDIMYGRSLDQLGSEVKYLTNVFGINDIESRIYGCEFIKKILTVAVILFFILFTLSIFNPEILDVPILYAAYLTSSIYIGFLVYWILRISLSKKFSFYFARACSEVISDKITETEKIAYLDKCLNSYNKYLRKNINLEMNDSSKILSKIIRIPSYQAQKANSTAKDISSPQDQDQKSISTITDNLLEAFKNSNKLSPAKYLVTLMDLQNVDRFLMRPPAGQKIKELIAIVATLGSTIIAIIQVLVSTMFK